MSARLLTLIDGSGFIFRAYHRLPPLTDPEGRPVGAVYGFASMLWRLLEEARASPAEDYLAVVLDHGKASFRHQLYADYKAHRPDPPEDLVPQFPLIRTCVDAFGLHAIERPGMEADDLIASYAAGAREAGMDVVIVSSDKDLMQLVRPGVRLRDTMADRWFDEAAVEEKWGVPAARLGDLLALMGDSVDNVPGVPGVGPKTAADLVRQFGGLEPLYARLDEVKRPRLRETLAAHRDAVALSRELVRLKEDCPLDPALDQLALGPALDTGRLGAFLERHGFRSLARRMGAPAAALAPPPGAGADATAAAAAEEPPFGPYATVTDRTALEAWVAEARAEGVVGFDTETTGLDAQRAELVGFSLATAPGRACYVPLAHVSGAGLLAERPAQLGHEEAMALLGPLLADPSVIKVGHNIKYDMTIMARLGLPLAPVEDTMLVSYALSAGDGGHGMDELAQKHLGHRTVSWADVAGRGRSARGFAEVPLDEATAYAAEDADVTLRLWARLSPRLWRSRVTRVYVGMDRPLVPVLAAMERQGVLVDRAMLQRLSHEFAGDMEALEARVHRLAGRPFQLGSTKQLGEVLFGELGLAGGRRGKSGAWSTDQAELERLAAGGAEIARLVLDWRQVQKLRSTYTDALPEQIHPGTGRVHSCFSMASTTTGRLSSNDPNLQNIPIRTETGRRIREAFVAAPGHVLLAADYNQVELRLMAHIAEVPELVAAYARGDDIHALTARRMLGLADDAGVPRDARAAAKTINFSILYGISAFGLAGRLGVQRAEAQRIIDQYFEAYPGIRRYMAETVAGVRQQGFVTTLFGRRIHVPGIRAKTVGERQGAERQAINAPVQGTAADLVRRAMVRVGPALAGAGCTGTRMLLQVHDELVFEAPDAEAEPASRVIADVMADAAAPAVRLRVPLGVEVGRGAHWGAAH